VTLNATTKERHAITLAVGVALGVLLMIVWQAKVERKTWEECVVEQMEDAHTNSAVQLLARVCQRKYPSPKAPH
jgi:hypothetical protein